MKNFLDSILDWNFILVAAFGCLVITLGFDIFKGHKHIEPARITDKVYVPAYYSSEWTTTTSNGKTYRRYYRKYHPEEYLTFVQCSDGMHKVNVTPFQFNTFGVGRNVTYYAWKGAYTNWTYSNKIR